MLYILQADGLNGSLKVCEIITNQFLYFFILFGAERDYFLILFI